MAKNSDTFTLPPSPKGLCFDKNYFLGESFSVDGFLHDHRNAGSLETMRDDLGVYLKVLRSAMIELINKDYADFVNLSANLIGLDKEINNIQTPLGQLREEVLHVRECLHDAMKELSGRLEQRRLLRQKKRSLQYLNLAQISLKKLNNILFNDESSEENLPIEVIERASLEYNHLKFAVVKCEQYITEQQKESLEKIGNKIQTTLGNMFLFNLERKNTEKLQQCLQIFCTLDRVSSVETLLRKEVVAPSMHEIICELALQKNSKGLKGVYSNILLFIDSRFKELLAVTNGSNKTTSIQAYNFLLNSFWPEVEYRIEVNMASIFAPGNPELYYSRYNDSLEFLNKFIQYFQTRKHVEEFYAHPQYRNFQHKWNLPVYFQIRFQEIAGSLENTLSEPINNQCIISETNPNEVFNLRATQNCWTSLTMCWAEGIFILALAHRFWKLTLQILSRYGTWISTTCKELLSSTDKNNKEEKKNLDKLKFQMLLYIDTLKLIESLPTLLEIVSSRLNPTKQKENLEKSLYEARALLHSHLPQVKTNIVNAISVECVVNLKQLNDIPRLFRKTNRDIPSKPSGYVAILMRPPTEFENNYKSLIGESNIGEWLTNIFCMVTTQYFTAVDDVLTSVHRTEESLRRLKHVRDRSSQSNLEKMGVSDDDKIRLQLKVDVQVYTQYLIDMNLCLDKIDKLKDLQDLVEKATNKSINNTSLP